MQHNVIPELKYAYACAYLKSVDTYVCMYVCVYMQVIEGKFTTANNCFLVTTE